MSFIGPLLKANAPRVVGRIVSTDKRNAATIRVSLVASAKNARYRGKNPEKEKTRTQRVFAAWRAANLEHDRARSLAYYRENKVAILARRKVKRSMA